MGDITKYIKSIKIGNIEVKNNVFLAPMAGITDLPFRFICSKFGAVYKPTEMVSIKGLVYNDKKTKKLMDMYNGEYPKIVQIFGSDVNVVKEVIEKLNENKEVDIIDINMGCPAPKISKNGDGAEILKDLNRAEDIIRVATTISKKPITVKTRIGYTRNEITAIKLAKICEKYGVAAIVVHGRTKDEYYLGKADLDIIKEVKQSVSIPVIGNGDIVDIQSAYNMFEYTGVDAIMIGRGAMGNPWIFEQILTDKCKEISLEEKLNIILEHLDLAVERDNERTAVSKMRKHVAWYLKGIKNNNVIKELVNKETTKDGVKNILIEYFSSLNN